MHNAVRPGLSVPNRELCSRRLRSIRSARVRGVAAIESALALPVILLLGMSALQWGLVFHGHQALSHAVQQGARLGSVNHADPQAIERGLSQGLAPWLFGASAPDEHARAQLMAGEELERGLASGWAIWRQLSPSAQSFADWSVPASDSFGNPLSGGREIPNDNLNLAGAKLPPASGVAAYRGADPVGVVSGQTLSDANLLKIEFIYGVPLTVPIIGRFAAWVMRSIDGCRDVSQQQIRLLSPSLKDSGSGANNSARQLQDSTLVGRVWTCPFYGAVDGDGRQVPRWPVRVAATVRMQSPARQAGAEQSGETGVLQGEALGVGNIDPAVSFEPTDPARQNPSGAAPTQDGSFDRAPGFLELGANRLSPPPLMCSG